MIEEIAVITVWAENVAETAHFYHDVLDLPLLPHHHGGRPHFKVGGAFLTIIKGKPRPAMNADPSRFPIFALRVSDLDDAVTRLEAHGVELSWGIEGQGDNRWVMFYDPAGNLIELT